MKTNADLEQIADALWHDHTMLRSEKLTRAIKLLRSIGLDAWREAREMVDDWEVAPSDKRGLLEPMDRIIQQLQLK